MTSEVTNSLLNKLTDLKPKNDYNAAINAAEELCKKSEMKYGSLHLDVADNYLISACLHYMYGDYETAKRLFLKCHDIRELRLGKKHPDVAECLHNLGWIYRRVYDFKKAEQYHENALDIRKKVLGKKHLDVARSYYALSDFFKTRGDLFSEMDAVQEAHKDYSKAIKNAKKSLDIKEKLLGDFDPDVAMTLDLYANLYRIRFQMENSNFDYEGNLKKRGNRNRSKIGPVKRKPKKKLYKRWADLLTRDSKQKDENKAEVKFKAALSIRRTAFGNMHPDTAQTLNGLGLLYYDQGKFEKAEKYLMKAFKIRKELLGLDHSDLIESCKALGDLYAAKGEIKDAYNYYFRAQKAYSSLIDKVIGFVTAEMKTSFLNKVNRDSYLFLSLVVQNFADDISRVKDAYDIWLNRKGVLLESRRHFHGALVKSKNKDVLIKFEELKRISAQLSNLALAGSAKDNVSYAIKEIELKKNKEKLEEALIEHIPFDSLEQRIILADCQKVAKQLPEKCVLVDFAKIDLQSLNNYSHYVVFILHSGDGNKIDLIDLGNSDKIDELIKELQNEIRNKDDNLMSSFELFKILFEPIRLKLGGCKDIFISPDAIMNLIPFEVLKNQNGKYLIEEYSFTYLSSGRELLEFGIRKKKEGKCILIGAPDFDMKLDDKTEMLVKLSLKNEMQNVENMRCNESRGFRRFGRRFDHLDGTKEEVEEIRKILCDKDVEMYAGKEAMEDVLRQMESPPEILHIATHGFFLHDQKDETGELSSNKRGLIIKKNVNSLPKIENPLLNTGIVLAGVNNAQESLALGERDGIVTAEEILGLNLWGTEMVVLSACETGIGEVRAAQGVFGLRRTFRQAGVESLVMSMWKVPDKETTELMKNFYKYFTQKKLNKCQALRKAALSMVEKHPYYWGGFILSGDPGIGKVAVTKKNSYEIVNNIISLNRKKEFSLSLFDVFKYLFFDRSMEKKRKEYNAACEDIFCKSGIEKQVISSELENLWNHCKEENKALFIIYRPISLFEKYKNRIDDLAKKYQESIM